MTLILFVVVVLALACSTFCSGSETGFLSVRRERIIHMAREGGERAKVIHEAISNMGRTMTAILVGNNLANVCYSSATAAFVASLGVRTAAGAAVLSFLSAMALLFFGEFMPKLLFSARPLRCLLAVAPIWQVFARVFVPFGSLVAALVDWLMPRREAKVKITPEAVLKILADRKDGVKLSDFERALIGRIMLLRKKGEFVIPETLLPALDDAVL